jgi:hypothetical protein
MLELVRKLLISILLLTALAFAQDSNPAPVQPKPQVFSGFVTDFTSAALSVSRKNASGKEMVHKSFIMDTQTKVEGKIKLKARVTVQFTIDGENNRAVRVIVRGS